MNVDEEVALEDEFAFFVLLRGLESAILLAMSTNGKTKIKITRLTYFHPRIVWHLQQEMSRTVCLPVVISRSFGKPSTTLTLPEDKW